MIAEQVFEESLRANDAYEALRAQIVSLHGGGHPKAEIVNALERLMLRLRAEARREEEDIVLDTLDALGGWCHSTHHLLPDDDALPQP